jgi:hypothetical protein
MRAAAFTATLLCCAATLFAEQLDVDSLLRVYASAVSRHRCFTASFRQRRYLSVFDRPLVSSGTITYAYPSSVKLHYTEPFEAVVMLCGEKVRRFRKEGGAFVEQPSLEIATRALTTEMTRWFSADFTEDFPYDAAVGDGDPRRIVLTPTRPGARALFSTIELTFAPTLDYIEKVKLVEQSGDSLVVQHDPPSFEPLSPAAFSLPGLDP